jgi:thiol-disulfide isomerase/thioredoxin
VQEITMHPDPGRAVLGGFVANAVMTTMMYAALATVWADAPLAAEEQPAVVRLLKDPAPVGAFAVQTIDGRTIRSADLRGKVVLVNFWATWCPPCRAEVPDLVRLQDKYRDQLVIIGISEDEDNLGAVRRFVADHGVNYAIAMATPALATVFPGVSSLPTTFVLDRNGLIVQRHLGLLDAARTELEVRTLAGLMRAVTIERVDPPRAVGLPSTAHVKEIPGIDLATFSGEQRAEVLRRLNTEPCTCGCQLTVAKCRIDDPMCGVSLPRARAIAAEVAASRKAP